MKYIFIAVCCSAMAVCTASAQIRNEVETAAKAASPLNLKNTSTYVAFAYGQSEMDGSAASLIHVRAGIGLTKKFALGVYASMALNEIRPKSETVPDVYMDYRSVGGFAAYTLLSTRKVQLELPLYVGYGEVEMDNQQGSAALGEANFLQLEPSALLQLRLHKHVRFNLGAGYRMVQEMRYRNLNQADLSGLTIYAGLKLGIFR